MAARLSLTTGFVFVRSWSGTLTGGTIAAADGTAAAPSLTFANELGSGLYRVGAGNISLQVLGVSRFSADGTTTSVRGSDGGAYLRVLPNVDVNSTFFSMSNGGTAKFTIPAVGATSGQVVFANGAGTSGVGLDLSSDQSLLLRSRDFTQYADLTLRALSTAGKYTSYNGVATAGWGVPAIQASARFTAQVAAKASVATYTVGAADGSFEVSCNVLVTTSTTHSFGVSVAYTDEGNTARTIFLDFASSAGFPGGSAAIVNANGAISYLGTVRLIRAKASTSITIATSGTFTTVTYNVEGCIKQVA